MFLDRLASALRRFVRPRRADRELNDELRTFVEMSVADRMRDGVAPEEARRLAMLELGGLDQSKEHVRSVRSGAWLEDLGRDLRYAVRTSIRQRGFTTVVLLTIALGIGANTAIFSLIDALMLRQLPVHDPRQLLQVKMGEADNPGAGESFSYVMVRALSDRQDIFASAAGFSGWRFNVGSSGSLETIQGAVVTGRFYDTLGLRPVAGRLLTRSDDEPGAPLVAVITHDYWERQFARRADVAGQTLTISGQPVTIVGVSPRGFVGANVGQTADITIAIAALPQIAPESGGLLERGNFWLRMLARPAVGLSTLQASARLNAVWRDMAEPLIAPHWPAHRRNAIMNSVFQLSPGGTGWTYLRTLFVRPLTVLMAAVAVVLLVACANIASLLLARASARQREIAVRLAMGAGRGRIVRQLLLENMLVSFVGAAFGLALAWLAGRLLLQLISSGPIDANFDLAPNWRVLGFTMAAAVFTAITFGIVPALQATAAGPSDVLRGNARVTSSSSRLLSWLVSAQVALSLVLLVGAGLFVRTLQNLQTLDAGFRTDGVLLVDLDARRTGVPLTWLDDLQRVPGVSSASIATHTPLSGSVWTEAVVPAGQPIPDRENAVFVGAGPAFFATMGIPLAAGREFTDLDVTGRPSVAIVNRVFAERFLPKQDAVGSHLWAMVGGEQRDLEIVGVSESTHTWSLRAAPRPLVYVAYAQLKGNRPSTLAVRTAGPLAQTSLAVRQLLQSKVPEAPIVVRSFAAQVDSTLFQERMLAALASGFGLLAMLLSSVGLYGLLAYGVARRVKEIGLRMALGAERRQVMALILKRAVTLVAVGVAIGLPAALAAARWIESMLFGLEPTDFVTLAGAIVLLLVTAQLAAYLPAWRASRVDPLAALRQE
jgi:predicted permease